MVVLGGDPRVAIPLGKFFKSKGIIDAVKHLKNTGGPRNFGKAFKLIASTVLSQGGGQRAGVDQVANASSSFVSCCYWLVVVVRR